MAMSEREKFEKWAKANDLDVSKVTEREYYNSRTTAAWEAWQAALSTRKPCGFGLIASDGCGTNFAFHDERAAYETWGQVNSVLVSNPYRVVPLFYEDQS
jgi:hypothetical protein